ncbi:unnamed protein product [Cylicocyclus nassatus]|uniref:Uncharacterized protein n=1 Tax=Cylicocyclus nassatus TaxID=53992 RepID=A0AA36M912_CYLNA|nr:unnamed protein product [Cylicocyclus nassatus]
MSVEEGSTPTYMIISENIKHAPKAKPTPTPSSSSSRSKHSRGSKSKIKKVQKKVQERKATIHARLSAQPIGATPKKKLDLIKKGMKKASSAYPTFDDVVSDWEDEEKKPTFKPKERELNKKEKMIAMGAKRQESAYPTMDDIVSDWETNEDVGKKKDGAEKQGKGDADDVDFELQLLEADGKGRKTKTKQRVS